MYLGAPDESRTIHGTADAEADMIVDIHTHLPSHQGSVPEDEERFNAMLRPDKAARMTNSVDDYLNDMEPVDWAFVFGIASRPVEADALMESIAPTNEVNINDWAADLAARYPDKVIGFMSVHPEADDAMDEVERCAHDLKLKGIKLGPNYQNFDPLGEPARRVYEYAQRRGLPIVFHQGTSPMRTAPLRYAHPLVMDEIAIAFPELRVVMAHVAHPWHADCIAVVRKHPNVFADSSAQFYRPWSMYNGLRLAYEWAVTDKLLFASDWPVTTPEESIAGLRGFNEFARRHHLPEVPGDVFEGIIHRDALKLLGLR
jgi:predicted TIM-barrel fold metal-dependent hydrolase